MMKRFHGDSYRILRLTPDATEKELPKVYRKLAMRSHYTRNKKGGKEDGTG